MPKAPPKSSPKISSQNSSSAEIELEIKIKLSPADCERLFAHFAARAQGRIRHKFIPRTYYDTRHFDLAARGLTLRLQYEAGREGRAGAYKQTVKFDMPGQDRPGGFFFARKECQDRVKEPVPDLSALSDPEARRLLKPLRGKALRPLFIAAVDRRYFDLSLGRGKDKSQVELAFDIGHFFLLPDLKPKPLCEVEIELKGGKPAALFALRDEILKLCPRARLQNMSKGAQGVACVRRRLSSRP